MQRSRTLGSTSYSLATLSGSIKRLCHRPYDTPSSMEYTEAPTEYIYSVCNSDLESMTDELGAKTIFRPCTHQKLYDFVWSGQLASNTLDVSAAGLPSDYSYHVVALDRGAWSTNKWSVLSHCGGSLPIVEFSAVDWSRLVLDVGNALEGQLEASVGMLVNLAQLGQTIRMFKNPFGLLTTRWRRSALTPKELVRTASNVWLEKRYGWDNFFRDLEAIQNLQKDVTNHITFLQSTVNKWTRYARSETVSQAVSFPSPSVEKAHTTFTLLNPTCTRRASFGCELFRPGTFSVLSRAQYACQRMGTANVAEALWDLLPFSFVVDWFIDLERVVKYLPLYWNRHTFRRMGYSVKTEYRAALEIDSDATITWWNGMSFPKSKTELCPEITVASTYVRTPGFPPDMSGVGAFNGLSFTHLADGAALIAQRL